jgi:hypothetical protein
MAAPVVGDAAIATRGEKEHLVFERVGGERPAMAENDRLTGAPILVIPAAQGPDSPRGIPFGPFM